MKTILLTAGRSRRMYPFGGKGDVELMGKTVLEWQKERIRGMGMEDVLVIGEGEGMVAQERVELGIAGALLTARKYVSGEVLVVSNNDFFDERGMRAVMEAEGDMVLLAKRMERYFPGGYVKEEEGRVVDIVEKPGEGNEPSDKVTLLCHKIGDLEEFCRVLEGIETERDDQYERAIAQYASEKRVVAVPYEGYWEALKYPWHILSVMEMLLRGVTRKVSPQAEIAGTARIVGEVAVEEGARIGEYAVVKGPAYIGVGAVVGDFSLVRGSSVEAGATVGAQCEVARSMVMRGAQMHRAYAGDSVLGKGCNMGAGSVTGNLRLDGGEVVVVHRGVRVATGRGKLGALLGDGVQVGVNVRLSPGAVVGEGSFVLGEVRGEVSEGSFVTGSGEVRKNRAR